jgi:hypothetical protein
MTTALTTLPPGITRNADPCWELRYPNGTSVDQDDRKPHFASAEEALREAKNFADDELGTPAPAPLPGICHMITAICGYVLDEADDGIVHYSTAEKAARSARDADWALTPIGWQCRPDCDNGCVEAVARYELEHPAPVEIAEDQDPLFEIPAQ